MIGIQWDALTFAGAFVVGAVFSAIVVLRLARTVAQFLSELGRKEPPDEPDTDRRR